MPPWCPISPYKGLFILIIIFVGIEYFFGTFSDTKSTFYFNTTKYQADSPFVMKLVYNGNKTDKIDWKSKLFKKNATYSNQTTVQIVTARTTNFTVTTTPEQQLVTEDENSTALPLCPDDISSSLKGKIPIVITPVPTAQQLEQRFTFLQKGGHWQPDECRPPKKVAIIIPFRCRGEHLLLFLQHMHPFLQRQQLDYTIYVLEQAGDGPFNRAMLMNVGFVEGLKDRNYDCFIFHDIDLLPEDDRNLYTCPEQPRHMSVAVDLFKYKLPYSTIFGGVCGITREHFKLMNGFSNSFWGWGGEDDDMSNRIRHYNLHISRYPSTIARYTMLTHKKEKPSPKRYELLQKGLKKYETDGLNNLKYTIRMKKYNPLYTWVLVDLEMPS